MVVSLSDIKHLELMDGLAERQAAPKSAETIEKASGLTPKLLRLANSLRANGFEDYALNIEDKMMRIKRAQTIDIYKVHKETGEDLVNEAHPDGDHNVSDGELGDVETIVSLHNKARKMVEKMPTGKLAAVVEMCKVVLGQEKSVEQQSLITQQKATATQIISRLYGINKLVGKVYGDQASPIASRNYTAFYSTIMEILGHQEITKDDVDDLKDYLYAMKELIRPGFSISKTFFYDRGIGKDAWKTIESQFIELDGLATKLDTERDQILPTYGRTIGQNAQKAKAIVEKLEEFQGKVNGSRLTQSSKDEYIQVITKEIQEVNSTIDNLDALSILEKNIDTYIAQETPTIQKGTPSAK